MKGIIFDFDHDHVPDPTPDHHDDGMCPSGWSGYYCTRERGHNGTHLAGTVTHLAAAWQGGRST